MTKEFKLIHDKYSAKRGGKSYPYDIKCSKCQILLFIYQKDGKGDLIRCYKDRLLSVVSLEGFSEQSSLNDIENLDSIKCKICKELIGVSFIYKAENRPAFRMIKGKFSRSPHIQG